MGYISAMTYYLLLLLLLLPRHPYIENPDYMNFNFLIHEFY